MNYIKEKEILDGVGLLVKEKNDLNNIIENIKSGKYTSITVCGEKEITPTTIVVNDHNKAEIVTAFTHVKDHIISIIKSRITSFNSEL